jgi:hypothetical protein
MMEAVRTSETSVDNHFTRQYNPEDSSEQYLFYVHVHRSFLSKNRLRISPAQVNTPHRFKVARPQSSVGFVPSKFSTDCVI